MHRLFTEEKAMFFCAFPASSPSSSFVCASVLCAPGPVSPFSPSTRGRPRSSAVFRLASFLPFFPPHALEQSAAKGPVPACPSRVFDRLVDGAAGFPATAAPRLRRKPVAFRGRSLQSGDVGSGAWEIPPQTPFVPAVYAAGNDKSAKELSPFALSDRRKPHWGGLEGQSPPNAIRTRRHARRVRKPCAARFPCAFPRPRPQAQGKRVLAEKAGSAGLFRQTESAKGLGPFALSGYFQQSQAPRRAFRRAAAFLSGRRDAILPGMIRRRPLRALPRWSSRPCRRPRTAWPGRSFCPGASSRTAASPESGSRTRRWDGPAQWRRRSR